AGLIGPRFAEWHDHYRHVVRSRYRDHRAWMFGFGVLALGLTAGLLMNMPAQFQPITDSDTSRINIEMVPGTTIEQTEAVADKVTALIEKQTDEVDRVLGTTR